MEWQKQFQTKTQALCTSGDYSIVGTWSDAFNGVNYVLFYGRTTRTTNTEVLDGSTDPAALREAADAHKKLFYRQGIGVQPLRNKQHG